MEKHVSNKDGFSSGMLTCLCSKEHRVLARVPPARNPFCISKWRIMKLKYLSILFYSAVATFLLVLVVVVFGCKKYDSRLSDLDNRIVELENDLRNTKEVLDSHGVEDLNL